MKNKKTKMASAPPTVSILEVSSSSTSYISPVGKTSVAKMNIRDSSPTVTVAETPSPASGPLGKMIVSPVSLQVTRLEQSPSAVSMATSVEQPMQEQVQKKTNRGPFDDESHTKTAKPFDEAVDDSGGNFEDVWASAEEYEDRMYLLSRMMTDIPSPPRETTLPPKDEGKPKALPFLPPGSPSPKPESSTFYGHQTQYGNTLTVIPEQNESQKSSSTTPTGSIQEASVSSHSTPSVLYESDVAIGSSTNDSNNLIVLTPTTPNEREIISGCTLKPHALFNSVEEDDENKENIPPHRERVSRGKYEGESTKTPDDEPGKLIPTPMHMVQDEDSDFHQPEEDMPWDCIDEYGAFHEGEVRQLMRMEQEQRDLEEGVDKKSRKSLLRKAFKKSPKTKRSSKQLDPSTARDALKSLRKLSSIHPPDFIEIEIKQEKNHPWKEIFEDEPLASLTLAAGGDTSYEGLDRSLVDPPRFHIGMSPPKSKKKNAFGEKAANRLWIRKAFYCTLLAILIVCAILVALFATDKLTTRKNSDQVDWQEGPEGEVSPYEGNETMVPEYTPESNLFEGDEIAACINAEPLEEMDRPYFGSTWKSFWDSRINTCGDQMSTGYSIWYSFSTNTNKLVEASTCNTADFDTQITVLSGSCSEARCVSFNDQACGSQSVVTWYAEANVTYYIMISGYREASGTFGLTLSEVLNNDDCADAVGPLVPGSVVAGTTAGAKTVEKLPQCGDVNLTAPGVWYEVGNVTGFYRAEILRGYTDFNGQVSIYRSMDDLDMGCGALICDKSSSTGTVTWLAEGIDTYYLYVNGVNGTVGDFDLFFGQHVPSTCREAKKLDPNTIGFLASTESSNPQNVESCGYTGYHTAPGLWFSVEGTGKILEVSTCGSLKDLDTQISVFAYDCDSLQCIGGTGQDYPCGDNGSVSWNSVRGVVYHIFVSGRSSRVGQFVLDIQEVSRMDGYSCNASLALELGNASYQSSTIDSPSSPVELCDGSRAVRGVWHEFLGTGKTVRISVCNKDTDFDARVSLYTGSCDGLSCVANTQNRCGDKDEILVTTHTGQVYYIFVHGPDSFTIGNYRLDVDESVINESCESAPTLELSPSRYFGSTKSATLSASTECGGSDINSLALWYRMVGTGETATISTCSEITDFNSDIRVFSGTCSSLICVGKGGTKCGNQSIVSFQTTLNEAYFVRVGGNSSKDMGNFLMDISNMSPFFGGN